MNLKLNKKKNKKNQNVKKGILHLILLLRIYRFQKKCLHFTHLIKDKVSLYMVQAASSERLCCSMAAPDKRK